MNNKSNELEKLNEQLKYTRRKYKKTIINSKMKLLKTKIASQNCIIKIEAYKGNCINKVVNTKSNAIKLVEESTRNNIDRINSGIFIADENLTKIYSLIDKTTYILKFKPSKISSFKHYISKFFSIVSNGLSTIHIHFAKKLAFPPILYSKSFTMSIIEVKSWHNNLYSRLTSGFKDFRKTLLSYKSKLSTYNSIIISSKARCKNIVISSRTRGKNTIKRFL